MTLKDIAVKVIDNYDLKTVVMNYVIYGMLNPEGYETSIPYENLVQFQVLECERPIEEAGYQLGEPWTGNIKSAPILFVSSTLGYQADELCPRYIPNDSPDGFEIAYTDRIFKERLMEGNMTVDQVITYCNTKFKKAPINGKSICVRVRDGIKAVNYWGVVRNNVEYLLPDDFRELLKKKFKDSTEDYVHELMRYVACTSVVPFKVVPSKSPVHRSCFDEDKTFEHCWNTFAEEIIALSGAKILVLVGDDVLRAFEGSSRFSTKKLVMTEKSTTGKRGTQDIDLYEWENRLIVNVGSNQGGMRNFSRYFDSESKVIDTLRAKLDSLLKVSKRQLTES